MIRRRCTGRLFLQFTLFICSLQLLFIVAPTADCQRLVPTAIAPQIGARAARRAGGLPRDAGGDCAAVDDAADRDCAADLGRGFAARYHLSRQCDDGCRASNVVYPRDCAADHRIVL